MRAVAMHTDAMIDNDTETNAAGANRVYIALGSNLERPREQIKMAIAALGNLPDTVVVADSGYFESRPMGPEDQPDYVNAVVEITTAMSAEQLLKQCQLIEKQQGRIKTRHWGERSIDLDILLYAGLRIAMDHLTLPHPGICERDFVYMPLLKLNPDIKVPGMGLLSRIVESRPGSDADFACQFAGNIVR